jgi:hypothetical protein
MTGAIAGLDLESPTFPPRTDDTYLVSVYEIRINALTTNLLCLNLTLSLTCNRTRVGDPSEFKSRRMSKQKTRPPRIHHTAGKTQPRLMRDLTRRGTRQVTGLLKPKIS